MCDPKFKADIKEDSTLITFEDVYAGIVKQKHAVSRFIYMSNIRDSILEQQVGSSLPGPGTGHMHATGGGGAVQEGEGGA